MPDWYLAGYAAAYQDADAHVRWTSNDAIVVTHTGDQLYWGFRLRPFFTALPAMA
jgi:hypothetical protein